MTGDNKSSGGDPFGDFQRWLMRSSARGLGRELKGQARRTFGGGSSRDVWEAATAEPAPDEAPECAWCPVCRAARRLRVSGPGLASHVAGAGDALLTTAQDTLAAFEAALSARTPQAGSGSPAGPGRPAGSPEGTGWPAGVDPGPVPGTDGGADAGRAGAADTTPGASADAGPAGTAGAAPGPGTADKAPGAGADAGPAVAGAAEAGEGQGAAPDGPDRRP